MTIPNENGYEVTKAWFAGGKTGALVREGCSKGSSKVKELPKGTLLAVEEEGAADDGTARLRISAPVAGWLSKKLAVARDTSAAPDPLSFGDRVTAAAPGPPPPTKPIGGRALPAWPARTGVKRADLVALAGAPGGVGDIYGQRMPRTCADVRKFGAAWLTKCMHAAGTLPKDNAVAKIVRADELPVHKGADCAGGAGRKMFLTVEYKIPDLARLHTELFVKLPWEPDFHMRGELSLGLGDGDGLEIATYVYLEHLLPCHLPKFYFGDIERATTNYVLVTERVPFAARGTPAASLPAGALHAACGKSAPPASTFDVDDAPEKKTSAQVRGLPARRARGELQGPHAVHGPDRRVGQARPLRRPHGHLRPDAHREPRRGGRGRRLEEPPHHERARGRDAQVDGRPRRRGHLVRDAARAVPLSVEIKMFEIR